MFTYRNPLLFLIITIVCVQSAPASQEPEKNQTQSAVYDYGKFNEVYDQRQNGSENYKINLDGVVVIMAPPESLLLSLAALVTPEIWAGGDPIYQEIVSPQRPEKPLELPVVNSEEPSSSTTTSLPPSTTESLVPETQNNTVQNEIVKRKYRLPGFIRSFISRRRLGQVPA